MGAFDDYVNDLDGKSDLDIVDVVKNLSNLHKQELSPVEAKIETLNATILAKDDELKSANDAVTKAKAEYYDISMQVPGATSSESSTTDEDELRGSTITTNDLFESR